MPDINKLGYKAYRDFVERLLNQLELILGEGGLVSVALFGSVAREEGTFHSDIDLLVIHRAEGRDPVEPFAKVLSRIDEWLEYQELRERGLYPSPEVIFMTSEELSQKPLILLDIMDHGMLLRDRHGFLSEKIKRLKGILERYGSQKILFNDGSWAWDLKPDWRPGDVIEIKI